MQQEWHHSYDVVVIGKGISGLTAAMEASMNGASVAVIFDSLECSSSLAYEGVFRLNDDGAVLEQMVREYGAGLSKPDMLAGFFKSYNESLLGDLGSIFPLANARPVGKKHKLGGPGILLDLESYCSRNGVRFFYGKTVRISTSDGAVAAVQVFIFPRLITFRAKCAVIATGGGVASASPNRP